MWKNGFLFAFALPFRYLSKKRRRVGYLHSTLPLCENYLKTLPIMEKEIVLYRTFDSSVEANIVKDVLETNGVPCFLSNEIFSSVLPLTNSSVGAIRLNIFAEDVAKADTILSTITLPDSRE